MKGDSSSLHFLGNGVLPRIIPRPGTPFRFGFDHNSRNSLLAMLDKWCDCENGCYLYSLKSAVIETTKYAPAGLSKAKWAQFQAIIDQTYFRHDWFAGGTIGILEGLLFESAELLHLFDCSQIAPLTRRSLAIRSKWGPDYNPRGEILSARGLCRAGRNHSFEAKWF